MTVDLYPASGLDATATIGQPLGVQLLTCWDPNIEPRPIPIGDLDGPGTLRKRIYWQWQHDPSWLSQDGGVTPGLAEIIGMGMDAQREEQFQIDNLRWLSTGIGETLDEIGAMVRLPRNGLGDDLYRRAIQARGASLIGDAGIDAVMLPARILLGDGNVSYAPAYPRAFCYIVHVGVSSALLELIVSILSESVAGAGIGAKILLAPPDSPGWDWSTPQTWAASWSSAYGAVDASVAAPWSWSISL